MANHIKSENGQRETLSSLITGKQSHIWLQSLSNELGRLAQGNDAGIKPTDTFTFIKRSVIHQGQSITYATFVCDYRPTKSNQLVAGGDMLSYDADAEVPQQHPF